MSQTSQTPTEMFTEMTTLLQPWLTAARTWMDESEKMHLAASENMTAVLDNGHRIARQNLELASTFNATVRNQMTTQMEKGYETLSKAAK